MASNVISRDPEPRDSWKKRLTAMRPLALPLGRIAVSESKRSICEKTLVVPQRLEGLAEKQSHTDVVIAAFAAYLSRLTGIYSFDIAFADTKNKNNHEGIARVDLDPILLHIELDPHKTFRDFLSFVNGELKHINKNEKALFEIKAENPDLLKALSDFEKAASLSIILVDSLESFDASLAKQMSLVIPKDEADAKIIYDKSVVDEDNLDRLLHHFSVFLQEAFSNLSIRISDLPLLNEHDRHHLLCELNDTRAEYPENKIFHEMVEEQVEETPDKEAVIIHDRKITYRELNDRSNQLARKLRDRGVKPDQIVGLLVDDNSIDMIIGMLSIMKAGGAFLAIDADLPRDRIEYMIADSRVGVLLSQSKLKDKIQFSGEVLNLDDDTLFTGDRSNIERVNKAGDLVYVFYTSGSTGKPKGVQVEHGSIVNQIYGLIKRYNFDSSLHHILLSSITFDPSVQQIFLPLTSGGKLFLVSKSTKSSTRELWDFIVSNQIDIVNTVPSLMNILLDQVNGRDNRHFKYVILAGEVFSKNLYLRLKGSLSAEKIINIYGPTEATINTTLYECNAEEMRSTIPIGKPLMNYRVMILDENQKLLPIEVPGEICISGVGLARGYLNNTKMTDEKFVANPFIQGERMYRTGDLGRWLDDGNLEFLGRIDQQVKIAGIRIELGEIEVVLGQHPAIKEAVVIKWEDESANARLVAFVVPKQAQVATPDEFRSFLKEKLPDYMVPSTFVMMDTLPLTPHGKVNRRALVVPEPARQKPEDSFISPRNELESQLVRIWEKVLSIKPIGIKDEFFALGGTSLLAMVLFGEIEKISGKRLPLATIFKAPTIEELAKILDKEGWAASWSPLVVIQPKGPLEPFFCVHGHRGNVIGFNKLVGHLGMEQPFFAIQARGLDGKPVGDRRIESMAADYINEILSVQPRGPYFLGGWCMGGVLAFEMAQQLQAKGEKVALVAMLESNRPNTPEFLPASTCFRRIVYKFRERIDFEIGTLRTMAARDKLSHIARKISTAWTETYVKIEKMIDGLLSNLHLSMPHSWAYMLITLREAHEKALLNYKPCPYNGRVAIFRASKQPLGIYPDPTLGWGDLITGKLELHEVPGHYLNVFIEPSVQVLGSKLKTCIDEARRKSAKLSQHP